jgi:AraC-like DNA-binding protein
MPQSLGHLNPAAPDAPSEVLFDRFELGSGLAELVRHVWVVRWNIPLGEARPQRVLSYPAFNAVFEPGRADLFGPDPRLDVHELRGASWAVGVLFRPAAASVLTQTAPRELLGRGEELPGAPLGAVSEAMSSDDARERLVELLGRWLAPLALGLDDRAIAVNAVCRLAEGDAGITRVDELAAGAGLSTRSLERLLRERVGVSPKWLIDCRRLHEASMRLRDEADTELSALAVELGYADYAHFSRAYKKVLGETPEQTRRVS